MGKFILVGSDVSGRSAILVSTAIDPSERAQVLADGISLHEARPRPHVSSGVPFVDLGEYGFSCSVGNAVWEIFRQLPDEEFPMHYTDTLDFNVVLSGTTTLVLETSEIDLVEGDCVFIGAVAHAWRAGSIGCALHSVLVGVPMSDGSEGL